MMCSWFTKNLGDAMLAGERLSKIEENLLFIYGKVVLPGKAAIFIRHESEGHLHCKVKVYLTSEAFILAKEIDADPCRRPDQNGASLIVGYKDAWRDLFSQLDG
jgi:hypothetical protein